MKKFIITCPKCGTNTDAKKIIADYFGEDVLEVTEAKKYMKEYNEKYEKTIAVDCKDVNKKRNKRLRLVK